MPDCPAVLILHNAVSAAADHPESDAGVLDQVAAVAAALTALDVPHRIAAVSSLADLPPLLAASAEPLVFNLVETLDGLVDDAVLVPAVCSAFGKQFTGSGAAGLLAAADKGWTKAILAPHGLPVPGGVVVVPSQALSPEDLPPGPWIVKPARTDASEGIDARDCLIRQLGEDLAAAVRRIHERYRQPAIVEQYIDGRELNVALLERAGELTVLASAEIDFSAFAADQPRIVDYAAKWLPDSFAYHHTPRIIPAPLCPALAARVADLARRACAALDCRDYIRVDMRLDAADQPYIIEVNPNPDITPDAGYAAALDAAGLSFADFVRILLANHGLAATAAPPIPAATLSEPVIRPALPADRPAVMALLAATGCFRPEELDIAAEVFDDAIRPGDANGYHSYVAVIDDNPVGWVCFGPAPCTRGAFDIYWLAVHPRRHGRGLGRRLLIFAADQIARRAGRLAVIETSSLDLYAPARRCYERAGYRAVATVPDFYRPGDDKIIFTQVLRCPAHPAQPSSTAPGTK